MCDQGSNSLRPCAPFILLTPGTNTKRLRLHRFSLFPPLKIPNTAFASSMTSSLLQQIHKEPRRKWDYGFLWRRPQGSWCRGVEVRQTCGPVLHIQLGENSWFFSFFFNFQPTKKKNPHMFYINMKFYKVTVKLQTEQKVNISASRHFLLVPLYLTRDLKCFLPEDKMTGWA